MVILSVIDSLAPGGAELHLLDSLDALTQRGHACHVVGVCGRYDLEEEFLKRSVAVHRVAALRGRDLLGALVRFGSTCTKLGPDILHGHLFFGGLFVALAPGRGAARARRVVTFHNLGYDSYPARGPWLRARKALDGAAMRNRIQAHTAVSEAVASHYRQHLRLPEVRVIPNGVKLDKLAVSGAGRAARSACAPLTIVCVGSLRREKGQRYLVEALTLLRANGLRPRVLFVGDGPLRQALVQQIALFDLGDQVTLLGQLARQEVYAILRDADVLVAPSLFEGLGIAAIESLGLGVPVIASSTGGLVDVVQDGVNGLLVPAADPQALAMALARVVDDRALLLRMTGAARASAEARFDIGHTTTAHEANYRRLLLG